MTWLPDVDAARAYLSNGQTCIKNSKVEPIVSRKTIYSMVAEGMKVSRLGDTEPRMDSKGRRRQGRMVFRSEWIDEFLEQRATVNPNSKPLTFPKKGAA